jgi:hypothetical protein
VRLIESLERYKDFEIARAAAEKEGWAEGGTSRYLWFGRRAGDRTYVERVIVLGRRALWTNLPEGGFRTHTGPFAALVLGPELFDRPFLFWAPYTAILRDPDLARGGGLTRDLPDPGEESDGSPGGKLRYPAVFRYYDTGYRVLPDVEGLQKHGIDPGHFARCVEFLTRSERLPGSLAGRSCTFVMTLIRPENRSVFDMCFLLSRSGEPVPFNDLSNIDWYSRHLAILHYEGERAWVTWLSSSLRPDVFVKDYGKRLREEFEEPSEPRPLLLTWPVRVGPKAPEVPRLLLWPAGVAKPVELPLGSR